MLPLKFAIARAEAVKTIIRNLRECEFPYDHSRQALKQVENIFEDIITYLCDAETSEDPDIWKIACSESLNSLFNYLPLLGFILRSTNVRNAFELHGPLLRLSRSLLGPDTKLLISSEWDYSPMTYSDIPGMADFVLLGFPSTESSNPLLVPLSGHELGHGIWNKDNLSHLYQDKVTDLIRIEIIENQWDTFKDLYEIAESPDEFWAQLFALSYIAPSTAWAMKQAEESFCDLVGLNIFGTAFLHSFTYLLFPGDGSRQFEYPTTKTRFENLIETATSLGISLPDYNDSIFQDELFLFEASEAFQFQLKMADFALENIIGELADNAKAKVNSVGIAVPDETKISAIRKAIDQTVPGKDSLNLGNLLNAAWSAYVDGTLWIEHKHLPLQTKDGNLKQVILKSIEVLEI